MPNAPFLAPERDPAFKKGRPKGSGVTYYTYLGVVATNAGSSTLTASTDYYSPIYADTPVIVDQLAFEVVTNASGNARVGLYPADTDWQPTSGAAPLADSGDISTSTTGVKTYTPGTAIFLPRGRYLTVMNVSGSSVGIRCWRMSFTMQLTTFGANGVSEMSVGRAYAAFPTPGTAWNTVSATTLTGQVALRVSQP